VLTSDTVFEVANLCIPKAFLVFLVGFIGKISDPEDCFAGYRAGLNAEFKKFIFALMVPPVPDKFIFNMFQYIGSIRTSIPCEEKSMVALVYFIGKPFLQAYGGR